MTFDPEVVLSSGVGDGGPLFEERHRVLASHLILSLVEHAAQLRTESNEGARAVAEHLGAIGLYDHLIAKGPPSKGALLDVRALVVVRELLAQVSPLADAIFAVQGLGSFPILAFGTDVQADAVREEIRSGRRIGAFALTEPEAGSDVASMQTRAEERDETVTLTGEKTLSSNVGIADHYIVFANADPSLGRRGITAYWVERGAEGVLESPLSLSSPHPLGALHLRGVVVPRSARIGEVGAGFSIAMKTLDTFRISVGAAANGMASRALELAIARVRTREQFGSPLAAREQVQVYIAEMASELTANRLLVARAAYARDLGQAQASELAAIAKLRATEGAQRIIDRAVQLFGGAGVLLGSEVEALYRDIRPLRIYEGTTEIQRTIIARSRLGRF